MKQYEMQFDQKISSETNLLNFNLSELWRYKDLIYYFTKRDFISFYKQTVLGPLWYLVQPIVSSFVLYVVFTRIANLSTGGIPPFLFYLSGNMLWMYFSENINRTSDTFIVNASVFGKVYFPRLTVPISTTISGLISLGIQFIIFSMAFVYFYFDILTEVLTFRMLLFPILIIYLSIVSFSFGILISSLTTKYRDLKFVLKFGLQLWMFASPIAYSTSQVPEKYLDYFMLNPITPIIEVFRFLFFQSSPLSMYHIIFNLVFVFGLLVVSLLLFNRVEKSFMDTV